MRKFWMAGFGGLAVLAVGVYAFAAEAPPKMITGDLVDLFCYVVMDMKGEDNGKCAEQTLKTDERKLPVALVDDATGDVYMAYFRRKRPAVNVPDATHPNLVPFIGKKVNAFGTVHDKHGVKIIEIHTIAEELPMPEEN